KAQEIPGTEGLIYGNGKVTLKRLPQIIRVRIQTSAEGKDIKEALAKLKEEQKKIREKLVALGADEKSIEFSDPAVGAGNDLQRMQVERMIRMRSGRPAPPTTGPTKVVVSSLLKAEWPLKAQDAEENLIEAYSLQEKIKAGD